MHIGAEQVVDQQVALDIVRFAPSSTRMVLRPSLLQAPTVWRAEFDCRSSPTMTVSGSSAMRAGEAEFQIAQLVAAERDAGQVVALDEDAGRSAPQSARAGSAPR